MHPTRQFLMITDASIMRSGDASEDASPDAPEGASPANIQKLNTRTKYRTRLISITPHSTSTHSRVTAVQPLHQSAQADIIRSCMRDVILLKELQARPQSHLQRPYKTRNSDPLRTVLQPQVRAERQIQPLIPQELAQLGVRYGCQNRLGNVG